MSDVLANLEELVRLYGAGGWMQLALVAAALFASGFAFVAAPRLRTRRARALALLPASALTASATTILGAIVHLARGSHLDWVVLGAQTACTCTCWPVAPPMALEHHALWLLVPVLVLAIPSTVGAVARATRRPLIGVSALGAAVAGSLAALVIEHDRTDALSRYSAGAYMGFRPAPHARAVIDHAPWIIAATAALALVIVLARRAKRPVPRSRSSLFAAITVFALGAAAFVCTRPHAADRRHPVSLIGPRWMRHDELPRARSKIDPSQCGEPTIAPLLDARTPSALRLDNRSIGTLEELAQDLDTMRRNWLVLHPRDPFSGELLVLSDPDVPRAAIEPALATAARVGYTRARLMVATQDLRHTHTLGTIDVGRWCVLDLPSPPRR